MAELCDFAKVLSRDTVDDACPSSGTTPDHVSDTANEISQRYRDLKAALTELKVASDQLAQFEVAMLLIFSNNSNTFFSF